MDNWSINVIDLLYQDSIINAADSYFLIQNLYLCSLSNCESPVRCHITSERIKLWEELSKYMEKLPPPIGNTSCYFITGSPGIGKSTIVFSWWINYALTDTTNRSFAYIHGFVSNFVIISFVGRVVSVHSSNLRTNEEVINTLKYLIMNNNYSLIVCDGTNETVINFLYMYFIKAKLVVCTSFQALRLSNRSLQHRTPLYHSVLSFSREEIMNAYISGNLNLNNFVNEISSSVNGEDNDNADAFYERYYYCGSNIRMLVSNSSIDDLKGIIDAKIRDVSNYTDLLSGNVGESSMQAVNSLKSLVQVDLAILLSEYVTKTLARKVDDSFITACRQALSENPVWQGWVTELEVLNKIQNKRKLDIWDKNHDKTTWKIEAIMAIKDENFDGAGVKKGVWLIPDKYNQGCFDALHFTDSTISNHSHNTLKVIQITNALKHDFKLKYVVPIIKTLSITNIEIIVVCRNDNLNEFVKGRLFQLRNLNDAMQNVNSENYVPFIEDYIQVVSYEKPKRNIHLI